MQRCTECGRVSDDSDNDFCIYCGSKKVVAFEQPQFPNGSQPYINGSGEVVYMDMKEARKMPIALILAFLPGLIDIYGLGHIFIGRWVRGFLFLAASGVILYIRYMSGLDQLQPYMFSISIVLFVIQMLDLHFCFKKMMGGSYL